jgi:DNA repair metallo-beta-lactamase
VDVLMAGTQKRHRSEAGRRDAFSVMESAARRQARRTSAAASQQEGRPPWIKAQKRGAVEILDVPYSEHSSCSELQQFVAWLQPVAVVPTVGGGPQRTRDMLQLLAGT